ARPHLHISAVERPGGDCRRETRGCGPEHDQGHGHPLRRAGHGQFPDRERPLVPHPLPPEARQRVRDRVQPGHRAHGGDRLFREQLPGGRGRAPPGAGWRVAVGALRGAGSWLPAIASGGRPAHASFRHVRWTASRRGLPAGSVSQSGLGSRGGAAHRFLEPSGGVREELAGSLDRELGAACWPLLAELESSAALVLRHGLDSPHGLSRLAQELNDLSHVRGFVDKQMAGDID
ncbi:unnamed protein product, partial [Prorocentrum cordatum]